MADVFLLIHCVPQAILTKEHLRIVDGNRKWKRREIPSVDFIFSELDQLNVFHLRSLKQHNVPCGVKNNLK